jgi:CubicO group peptidase (beta-lactamase class C family)
MHAVWWLAIVSAFACRAGGATDTDTDPADPVDRFGFLRPAVERDLADNHATVASVAVWRDGEVIWAGGYAEDGFAAPGANTLFMIGSDTKKIAAISALRRVDAGKLQIGTPVKEVLPELRMRSARAYLDATLHDLMSHQGGVVDGAEFTRATTDAALRDYTFGSFSRTAYTLAPPGTFWNYSNPNHSMTGLLDETAAGVPWADLVEDEVFAPLGMSRTVARKESVDEDVALGIGLESPQDTSVGEVALADTWESAYTRPAGLVWSTPGDQMRLAGFLVDGSTTVLKDETRALLVQPAVPIYPDIPGTDYGYGLFIGRGIRLQDGWRDVPVWSHGGNTLTHTSTFYVLPDQRFAISILSNGLGDDFSGTVAAAVAELVDLPAPTEPPTPNFSPEGLDALVGTYSDPNNVGDMIISREGDRLRVRMPALEAARVPYEPAMRPLSTRVWIIGIQGQDLDFSFVDGPDGEVYLRNRSVVAVRTPDASLAPRPAPDAAAIREWASNVLPDPVPALMRPAR